jgi:RNA ligase (TIGR02306 family)
MSSFSVTVERLDIVEHPNADALELARVGAYHAVVRRGEYQTGDLAIYIPEQALLPEVLVDELGLTGRLAGPDSNRVKAVRLRGELSQGIVCRPVALTDQQLAEAHSTRADMAQTLGITKWVPVPPSSFDGQLVSAPDFMPWIDIENIKRFPDIFTHGEPVHVTEKLHGTACAVTWDGLSGLMVSSKGLGGKYAAIVETATNVYWRAARANNLDQVCAQIAARFGAHRVGLYGEVYGPGGFGFLWWFRAAVPLTNALVVGRNPVPNLCTEHRKKPKGGPGIQDLHYGLQAPAFACFDARVLTPDSPEARWLERDELAAVTNGLCDIVPTLYEGPYDYEALAVLAEGTETVSGSTAHLREGLVIRATPERYGPQGRAIAKLVSAAYLTRKGGTEFE